MGVAVEWLTTFSPLPVNLALCQYRTLPVLQVASVAGIWGVSFLLWWSNAALADALLRRRARTAPVAVTLGALLVTLGCGWFALAAGRDAAGLRVAAVQDHSGGETALFVQPVSLSSGTVGLSDGGTGSLPVERGGLRPRFGAKGDSGWSGAGGEVEPDREALTRRAAERGARLIVWSEGCLGSAFSPETEADETVSLARELKTHLVVGYTQEAKPQPFNVAAIVAPDGSVKGEHRKIHLYMGERQGVQGGRDARSFQTDLGRIGVEICFDSCYTDVTRRIVRDGARLVAMPNYDPPTPRGVLHYLHAAMLPFRAVENRVAFVRADATGCSQIIDPSGRMVGQSPLYAADALVGDVHLGSGQGTPFTHLGDWLAYLCLLATVGLLRWAPSRTSP